MPARIGLALSGGGAKGAFTVGALKVIRQKMPGTPTFPVISGTSTGSLVGTLLAINDFTTLVDIYSKVQTKNIVNPHHALIASLLGPEAVLFAAAVIGGTAIYDTSALRSTIRANANFQKIKNAFPATLLVYNTVNLQTGEVTTFNNKDHAPSTLEDALLASANMPVLMDPVPITAQATTQQHVDGGVLEFLPLGAVYDAGIPLDLIIAISTAPLRPKTKKAQFTKIIDILGRTIDLLDTEVGSNDYFGAQQYNAMLQMLENAEGAGLPRTRLLKNIPAEVRKKLADKRPIPIVLVAPKDHLDLDSLDFDSKRMRELMDEGVTAAKTTLASVL